MRLPSVVSLAGQSRDVVARFPWTMAAAVVAAVAAIVATTNSADPEWGRIAMAAALGIPLTIALALLAEERGWSRAAAAGLHLAGIALLILFYFVWPGPERKHEAIRYFQLSAGLHLLVAFLPFVPRPETHAFWQYNRRLFLGFLRAYVFSQVLFIGLAIALGALDKLFGVDVPAELYGRTALTIALVVNTAIFLAVVPVNLQALATDREYPRVLKLFSQYILTPLVFTYLLILLAYLVKIVIGGEWPSGWIGWLVTSVAIAGLLGFLLIHPLRDEPDEPWIRTYSRWLFVGLIPAAVMLLVAFWKRILPYGLTELRLLGVLLGLWLLVIAVRYTVRQRSGIQLIPFTLAILFLLTSYGPLSVTRLSVGSQGSRLRELVAESKAGHRNDREASAALRFLLDHGARQQIATAVSSRLPPIDWAQVQDNRNERDSTASRIMAAAGMRYLSEHSFASRSGPVYFSAWRAGAVPISGYDWMMPTSPHGTPATIIDGDSIHVVFDTTGITRVTAGRDTLSFDLRPLARAIALDSTITPHDLPPARLRVHTTSGSLRGMLALQSLSGRWEGDSLRIDGWQGTLFLGR
ncbi:MAG TPA: DUF4153 domain-containing protein [Gemmatimonadales bacterium]|nr:DUF4153 domain-containing protein [Gemmatimonadales bacterium]